MNPLNRPNDKPEDPLQDLDENTTPLASGKTVAEKTVQNNATEQNRFPEDELDPSGPNEGGDEMDREVTPPGGRNMIDGYTPTGEKMQSSREGGREYTGSMMKKKIIKGDSSQVTSL